MTCNKEPINKNTITIEPHQLRCTKRKKHKDKCEMTYTISWYGKQTEENNELKTPKI